jgi:transcriptional regulator with XRE-family HTH domain
MDKEGGVLMSISSDITRKLTESKEFREEFVAALVKRAFPLQVRTIRKKREMSQEQLAEEAGIEQGVVSRAENPNYGNLTFNTALRISAGFDLAFIPKIVTFTEFLKWAEEITQGFSNLPGFEGELATGEMGEQQSQQDTEAVASADAPKPPRQGNVISGYIFEQMQRALSGTGNQTITLTNTQPLAEIPFPPHQTTGRAHGTTFGAAG